MKDFLHHLTTRLLPYFSAAEARETAFWIIEESTGLTRTQILTGGKGTKNIPNIEIILQRIAKKEPIQYIFQHVLWNGLDLKVTPDTLIPRPETAELVQRILSSRLPARPLKVLDVGTGSGCIAIALRQAMPEWQVTGLDISAAAVAVAQENAVRNHVDVHFVVGDIMGDDSFDGPYDILVSNPPYVRNSEAAEMTASVLDYEPHTALFVPDEDPLLFYRRIAERKMASELWFEINEAFGPATQDLLAQLGYTDVQLYRDSYGKDRFITARRTQIV